MGHYDSLREFDRQEENDRREKASQTQLAELNEQLNFEDRELLIKIARNLDDFRAFFRVINNSNNFK